MLATQPSTRLLRRLWRHISPRRRTQFGLLLVLTVLSSFAEVVSIGSVVPFIGIMTQPARVFASPAIARVAHAFGITAAEDLVLPLAIGFAGAAVIAGAVRLLLLWATLRLGNTAGAELGIEVYRRTLYQPYKVHVARSSSEIVSGITQKVGTATNVMISAVIIVTTTALLAAIMLTLLVVDPLVASVSAASFGVAYALIAWRTRRRLIYNSQLVAREQTRVVKALQEGLGAIRDVLLDGAQEVYCAEYRRAAMQLQRASAENAFMAQAPRYAMESLGMALIAVLVLVLSGRAGGVAAALPILGLLALGAERLLPLMQQLYGNWSTMAGSRAGLVDVLALLDQPLPSDAGQPEPQPLALSHSIGFDGVRFQYATGGPWVLDELNLTIPKGARVGVVGSTGSGKSTALDLLMGLLEPTGGVIRVDGQPIGEDLRRAWQRSIAHVPQAIFLADTTIAENIAFGIAPEDIDYERVREAAAQAKIAEFIESRPGGFRALVGERGVRLSGGQRQRIGIARALYKRADVIVFDEATSALDNETEQAVMHAIDGLGADLTVLIIAHRLTTLKNCTMVVELRDGGIGRVGTYQDIVSQAS